MKKAVKDKILAVEKQLKGEIEHAEHLYNQQVSGSLTSAMNKMDNPCKFIRKTTKVAMAWFSRGGTR